MAVTVRSVVLTAVRSVQRIVDLALTLAIVAVLVLFLLQINHSPRLDDLWLIYQLRKHGDPVLAGAGSWLNVAWPSSSFSVLPLGVAFLVWLAKIVVDAIFINSHRLLGKLISAPVLAEALAAGDLAGLDGAVAADSEQAREQLLRRYREIEQALKAARRKQCAFLSVDVVGSTQMKVGENEHDVAATFQAYEEMLKKIFEQHGAWKQAWTPDGVMVCFLQLELAVGAAQRVLQSLKRFNEVDNKLRTPFRIRCGLNMGEVPIYEDSKLEKVADHAIDVAGHMQKQSRPDALTLSAELYTQLADKAGFRPAGRGVDGMEVYEWPVESSVTSPATAS